MKSPIIAIICFLLFAGRSCSGRLVKNNLLTASDNLLAFDRNCNSNLYDGSRLQKDAVLHCDHEMSPWSSSTEKKVTNDENKLSFRLSPTSIQNKKKADESPAMNKAKTEFHLLPKGKVTLSGPSPKVNSMVIEQRLSKSKNSPGVGHMQMTHPRSQTINGDIPKSHQSNRDDKRNKRKLRSTRSPGVGH